MLDKRKKLYIFAIFCFAVATLGFRPGVWLTGKPASTSSPHYVRGWEDGCISGTNSYSLLYAPMMEKPFIKEIEVAATGAEKEASGAKDFYKSGWNEGFTLCRYYQSSVYELMQFAILIVTLLFIGYLIARRKP